MCIVGVRDPLTIANLDAFLDYAKARVTKQFPDLTFGEDYQVHVHPYGAGTIMGDRDPRERRLPDEIGIVVEAVAPDEDLARMVCRMFRKTLMVAEYPGQKATTGKAAIMADEELRGMDTYQWTMYHTMRIDDPLAHARIELVTVDGGGAA